jgi:hypothetical protein
MLTLASFPPAGAAGHFLSVEVRPAAGSYLILQAGADIALYLGFHGDGSLEFNHCLGEAWGQPLVLPLASGWPATTPCRLKLGLTALHAEVALDGQPRHVARLGVEAARITGIQAAGEWTGVRLQARALPEAALHGLLDRLPARAATSDSGRVAVVASAILAPAVADALAAVERVVALVPSRAQLAALVAPFREELATGRLMLLPGTLADHGAEGSITLDALAAAFGRPVRIYAEEPPVAMDLPRYAAVPATGPEVRKVLEGAPLSGLRLLRAVPCGPRWGRAPALPARLLAELLLRDACRPMLGGMVLLGSVAAGRPA